MHKDKVWNAEARREQQEADSRFSQKDADDL